MEQIISPYQNGFVKGRSINDNIFLASELMTYIHKARKCKTRKRVFSSKENGDLGLRETDKVLVKDLILDDGRGWDHQKVLHCFGHNGAQNVLQVPVSRCHFNDMLAWKGSSNRVYKVKLGYHRLMEEDSLFLQQGSFQWSNFWKIKAPPRLLMFLWRVYNNALPNLHNLRRHHSQIYTTCQMCDREEEETLDNLFVRCPFARAIWFGSPMSFRTDLLNPQYLQRFIEDLLVDTGNDRLLVLAMVLLNNIWEVRNKLYMEGNKKKDGINCADYQDAVA
ncbi:ribonuclease H [Senna tora]|uniref:Ribonuclease H n=1 Tax=Senna tora TaxID=362788 RepID=A0A834TH36_9FABA|nr:ribonuclease H [Senna tora]